MERNIAIAENLVKLRKDKRMTQAEMAEMLGISISAYSKYEIGERVPGDKLKIKIAKFYKKSVQSIFFNF